MANLQDKKVVCSNCGEANPAQAKFCGECGNSLPIPPELTCNNCGKPISPSVKFCAWCGTLASTKPGEGPPPERMPFPPSFQITCNNCGNVNPPTVKYCAWCGTPASTQPGITSTPLLPEKPIFDQRFQVPVPILPRMRTCENCRAEIEATKNICPKCQQVQFPPDNFGRVTAYIIDNLMILATLSAILFVVNADFIAILPFEFILEPSQENLVAFLGYLLVYFAYFFLSEMFLEGQTLGKAITGVRIVGVPSSNVDIGPSLRVNMNQVFLRTIMKTFDLPIFNALNLLWMLKTPSNYHLGDQVAKTRVVSTKVINSLRQESGEDKSEV